MSNLQINFRLKLGVWNVDLHTWGKRFSHSTKHRPDNAWDSTEE